MINVWRYGSYYQDSGLGFIKLMMPFMLIDLILRGFALWKAARKDQNVWYIFLLIVNSMGILPLIYLLLNRDKSESSKKTKKPK